MDRRNFMKQCTLLASGLTLSKGLLPNALFASDQKIRDLSLNLITDAADKSILLMENLLKQARFPFSNLKFREVALAGKHVGDIVLVRNNNLIDFRTTFDDFSRELMEISRELGFPKNLTNPVLLRFSTENSQQMAKQVNVYHKNILSHQFGIDQTINNHKIAGSKGFVVVTVKDGQAKITSASCKHKTCMKMGNISRPGQNLVCIPNEVRIAIEGQNEFGVDGVVF